ncbi:DUF3017 domain-containing protein [Rhodococcus triatomae]|uniref:DUF3017 domain-containing protein n=1 Tax=Rhodococcus triatomae TaxID=300028 RepID=A0A1G8FL27_9NOCA|nr:DUF3017 domain-containing protein [Rhodococcus triatomae]QNG19512.1 DUF3017 domain-containing protein [Rhodococcus triatomae]QNG24573.1 DUF3017 domain-containing protein [Rhodococcus triatomae]SDH82769.1 Protein of unknown function [Rhodococcus triatomae]
MTAGALVKRNFAILVVLAVIVAALVLVAADRWRRGALVFGAAVLVAAVLRLVLSEEQAGLLAVRGKPFDVTALTAVGGAIVWLAISIDPLGTG